MSAGTHDPSDPWRNYPRINELVHIASALDSTLAHYDEYVFRGAPEFDARDAAVRYLRRKLSGALDAEGAAVALADALARRAAQRPQPGDDTYARQR
jgi:hypothetical protein